MTQRARRRGARFLPKYVTAFEDRHGKVRYRYRRKGHESGYFKGELGSDAFRAEYAAFEKAKLETPVAASRWPVGSNGDLVTRYVSVPARLGPKEVTRQKVLRILGAFRDEFGNAYVADVNFEHIDAIVAAKREKQFATTQMGKRAVGGIEAARKLRKELVRLFDYAEKIGMRPAGSNPARQSEHVRVAAGERSKGYRSWTEEDIAAYRERHPLGTGARLALELLLWTGQRRGDCYVFGPKDILGGRFRITQNKGGKELWLPVAPQLLEAITAMPALPQDAPSFLVSELGRPYSYASFGNKMRDWCDQAGLPNCTAHGLRKANARRMAELGMSNRTLKAVGGWTNDREVSIYTAGADQALLAEDAIGRLSAWERLKQAPEDQSDV